jgi:hypothetical protein
MGRLRLKATEDQVKQMAANAANHSRPVGMGMIHYNPAKTFESSDFRFDPNYKGGSRTNGEISGLEKRRGHLGNRQ